MYHAYLYPNVCLKWIIKQELGYWSNENLQSSKIELILFTT